jgi:hypothetical protein
MTSPRFRSSCALAVVLALAACAPALPGAPPSSDTSGGAADAALPADASNAVRPDAHGGDASPAPADAGRPPGTDAASPDAGRTGGSDAGSPGSDAGGSSGGGGSTSGDGVISCFTEGNPGATCTQPAHCCFSNYSSQHDGACSTTTCTWGTMECDGPEDCAGGQRCCAHAIISEATGLVGYQMACQASACGAAPANQEMCHTTASAAGTCSSPTSRCVTAFGNDNDLPPTLHICQ